MPPAVLIVPGRLDTPTGGYGYDRRIVSGLTALGWNVRVEELDDSFPEPTSAARAQAAAAFERIADGTPVLVDGLAFGVLAEEAAPHAGRLPLVALVHHPLARETGIDAGRADRLRISERRALSLAEAVVVTSRATGALLPDYGVDARRVCVIEPGTDAAPLAQGSGGPEVHLLCVATLIPRKGHAVLLRALARLTAAGTTGWRLTCVGSLARDEWTAARLHAQADEDGLTTRVTFAGEMETTALAAYYAAADVFVLPTFFEGYGMAVAEALARGLPVIATDTGGIGDLVGNDAGVLVPAGDVGALSAALERVISDADARNQLAAGARQARERLPTWEDAAASMANVLERAAR